VISFSAQAAQQVNKKRFYQHTLPYTPAIHQFRVRKKKGISHIEKRFSSTATAIAYIGEIVLTEKYTSLSEL